ncbi:MAG: extracellular solute-binding protein [Chloroflexota bacterium]|nr:extracellular solute-binding protein [Chloroflexota bacterium]
MRSRLTRRTILGGMGVGLAATFAAACGAGAGMAPAGDAPAESEEMEAKEPAMMEKQKVLYWSHSTQPFHEGIGAEMVAEFNASQDAVEVFAVGTAYGDTKSKLPTVVAAGSAPDISFLDRYITKSHAAVGATMDITPFVKASAVMQPDDVWDRILNDVTYKGRHFGWPWGPDTRTLFLNHDVLIEVGIDPEAPIGDWEDFHSVSNKVLRREGDKITRMGFVPNWGSAGIIAGWMIPYWQQGAELTSADETKATMDNAEMAAALEHSTRFYDEQGGWDTVQAFREGVDVRLLFTQGGLGLYFDTYSTPRELKYREEFEKIDYSVVFEPYPDDGEPATYGGGWSNVIPTGAKSAEGAFKFLEFLFMPPQDSGWASHWNRIPVRKSVGNSEDFIQGDPDRAHAIAEMPGAHWVVTAAGGPDILGAHIQLSRDAWQHLKTIPEAMKEANAKTQQLLDEWEANSVVQ